MVPLREPRPRRAHWHITLAHGHYEDDGVVPLRPSWLISNAEIEATQADYLALGHWNRAARWEPDDCAGVLFGIAGSGEDGQCRAAAGEWDGRGRREAVAWD